jgi:6-pyruvoyltetrahydropterin/6-carboxytetrahydropterin synthase
MKMELTVKGNFASAHQLKGYEGVCKDIHGHTFNVEVTASVSKLNDIGIGIDFYDLKNELDNLIRQVDHKILNEVEPFTTENPTSENIAIWLFKTLAEKLNSDNVKINKVLVMESPDFIATYYGE